MNLIGTFTIEINLKKDMKNIVLTGVFITFFSVGSVRKTREIETVIVRPVEIHDVLINPGNRVYHLSAFQWRYIKCWYGMDRGIAHRLPGVRRGSYQ